MIADDAPSIAKRMEEIKADRWRAIQDKPLEEAKAEDFTYVMYGYTPPAVVTVPGLPTLELSDFAPYTP